MLQQPSATPECEIKKMQCDGFIRSFSLCLGKGMDESTRKNRDPAHPMSILQNRI